MGSPFHRGSSIDHDSPEDRAGDWTHCARWGGRWVKPDEGGVQRL